jgi:aminoglycoside phosphotransferase (APT) family kinase protein
MAMQHLPVDISVLEAWLREQGHGSGPISDVRALTGGTQNILLAFDFGGRSMVLRRPPEHAQTDGSVVIQREARLLKALGSTDVPHPRFICACDEPELLGAFFYIMEAVDGFNAHQQLPAPFCNDPALRNRMALALVDRIADLGLQDHIALGLEDFGRPAGFLGRQVKRWRTQLEGYGRYAGWPGAAGLGDIDGVGRWLDEHMPLVQPPGIIHGDVHLANVLYRFDAPEIAALVDWELSTIGDPLVDIGWLLGHWPNEQGEGLATTGARPWDGFPTGDMLVARYAERSGRDVSGISWYAVLACYKRAAIIEGTYARACAGMFDIATGEELHRRAVALIARAEAFITE